jgi:hypothetical protein
MGQILSILWEILSVLWEICYLIGIFRNHSSSPPPRRQQFWKVFPAQSEKVGQISFRPLIYVRPCMHISPLACFYTDCFEITVRIEVM